MLRPSAPCRAHPKRLRPPKSPLGTPDSRRVREFWVDSFQTGSGQMGSSQKCRNFPLMNIHVELAVRTKIPHFREVFRKQDNPCRGRTPVIRPLKLGHMRCPSTKSSMSTSSVPPVLASSSKNISASCTSKPRRAPFRSLTAMRCVGSQASSAASSPEGACGPKPPQGRPVRPAVKS